MFFVIGWTDYRIVFIIVIAGYYTCAADELPFSSFIYSFSPQREQ